MGLIPHSTAGILDTIIRSDESQTQMDKLVDLIRLILYSLFSLPCFSFNSLGLTKVDGQICKE